MTEHNHPLHGELFTPITPEILELLEGLHRKYGSWLVVAYHTQTKTKVLRNVRKRRQSISMTLLDRIITETGIGRLDDYEWFTPEDLVALGLWKPTRYVEGRNRSQDGKILPALTPQQRRLVRRKKPKKKKRPPPSIQDIYPQ